MALHAAAETGHLKVVERLLAANADVNAAGYGGQTALQAAAENGHFGIVGRLKNALATLYPEVTNKIRPAASKIGRRLSFSTRAQIGFESAIVKLAEADLAAYEVLHGRGVWWP
jgi:ankyrin repeat protein